MIYDIQKESSSILNGQLSLWTVERISYFYLFVTKYSVRYSERWEDMV